MRAKGRMTVILSPSAHLDSLQCKQQRKRQQENFGRLVLWNVRLVTSRQTVRLVTSRQTVRLVTSRQTVRLVTSMQTAWLPQGKLSAWLPQGKLSAWLLHGKLSAWLPQGRLSTWLPQGKLSAWLPQGKLPEKRRMVFGVERAQRTLLRSKEKPHHCWRNEMIIINSFCKAYLRPLARVALFCAPRGGWEGGGTGDPMPFFYTTQRGPHAIPLSRVQAIPSRNVFQGR